MHDKNEMNRAIERLTQVKWFNDFYDNNYKTCQLLVREWLRRMALWGKALNATHKWPFISIYGEIFDEQEMCEPVIIEISGNKEIADAFLAEITVYLRKHSNIYTTIACLWYVRWSGVKYQKEIIQFNLPDPYEPLIVFFELGGWLRKEQYFLDGVMIDINNWKEYDLLEPFISLDEEINLPAESD